ncbi:MAG: pseudouridine synthase [Tissierellaceae bacterium]
MIKTERLDKIVSNMGYGSRKEVKRYIKDGRVKVNDLVVLNNELKVDPHKDMIFFDDEKINYRQFIYLMMNKPKGLVSSTDDPKSKTVIDILTREYINYRPFPLGRLDKDTEGLLLISNDGKLAHELLSPKKKVNKTYYVEVDDYVGEEYIAEFQAGIVLDDGYKTLPSQLEIINSSAVSRLYLTIQEGKFHQVKRMFEAIGMKVLYLKRISMGRLVLDQTLEPGQYRELSENELNLLKNP